MSAELTHQLATKCQVNSLGPLAIRHVLTSHSSSSAPLPEGLGTDHLLRGWWYEQKSWSWITLWWWSSTKRGYPHSGRYYWGGVTNKGVVISLRTLWTWYSHDPDRKPESRGKQNPKNQNYTHLVICKYQLESMWRFHPATDGPETPFNYQAVG